MTTAAKKTGEFSASARREADSWARRSLSANGFGDAAVGGDIPPTSYELHRAASAQRSRVIGDAIVGAIDAATVWLRNGIESYRRQREAGLISNALAELDDRTLRDIGFDRSEIRSVAAELVGEAEETRQRRGLPARMPRYRLPTPRFALGVTAAAVAALTIALLVVAPAIVEAGSRIDGDTEQPAACSPEASPSGPTTD